MHQLYGHHDMGSQTPTARPKYTANHRNSSTNISTSNTDLNNVCPHGPHGKSNNVVKTPTAADNRRVSMGSALKSNFVVSQSDLWDTHTLSHAKQHSRQSPRNYANNQRCTEHSHIVPPYEQNTATSPIQRSVSEKNRNKHRHKPQKGTVCQSETDSEREREPTPPTCVQQRKLNKTNIQQAAHHHSSPNVAPDKQRGKHRNKTESSIYGASSETELLDGETAILPIFRKLLTEKSPNYRGRNMVGQSCPNISIKCDIVEYL